MDLFERKNIDPMLIKDEVVPFDDADYLFELKFDGIRCVAFVDANKEVQFYNKRHMLLNPHFPELANIHKFVRGRCILDGEVFIMNDGRPNFSDVQKRALTNDTFKIELHSKKFPATFVAYDILFYRGKSVEDETLLRRKEMLQSVIKIENERFSYSRFTREFGVKLYEVAESKKLEGIVAKRVDSKYFQGKKTKDWLKIKSMLDDDFVIVGYTVKDQIRSLVLAQYSQGELVYKGKVAGISKDVFLKILNVPESENHFDNFRDDKQIIWIKPELVCKVKFMEYTTDGGMRQPVFVGLRDDKMPYECVKDL